MTALKALSNAAPEDSQQHSWQPNNLIQLAANPPEPPTIGGLLYPGKRTVLSGETESMKTWLALILAKAELDAGYPVAWIDLDAMGPGAMLERLQLLGVPDKQIADDFLYYEPADQLGPTPKAELTDLIEQRGIRYCVIDAFNPILTLHGLDPNVTTDIEKFWWAIADPICRAGAACVLLDHVVKNPDNRGKYATGSERKASGAIVHLGFRLLEPLTKGGRGRTLLTVHKDRPGYLPRPTIGRLVLNAEGDQIDYRIEPDKSHDGDTYRPTVLMEKVSRQLERENAPLSKKQIEDVKLGKNEYVRKALDSLAEEGYVTRQDGPRGAHIYTTIRPYREAEDNPDPTSPPPRPDLAPNLRSSHTSTSPHPLRGRGEAQTHKGDLARPRPRPETDTPGEPIHEYDHPPLDEAQAHDPYDQPDERWWDK